MGMRRTLLVLVGVAVVVAGAVRGTGAQAPQPQAPPATAVLLGQVVDADSGEPVPEVTVTVAMRAPAARAGGAGLLPGMAAGANSMRLLTGADGKFVVRDIPVANVQLSTQAPGYVNGGFGQSRPGGPVGPFVVTSYNVGKVTDVKIRIWRTATITGVVTDEHGEPRPGVEVRVLRRTFVRGQPRLTQQTAQMMGPLATDDRGVYRISGLVPGDYVVMSPQTQMSMPAAVMENAIKSVTSGDVQGLMSIGLDAATSGGAMLQTGMRVGDLMVGTQAGQLPVPQQDGRLRVYTTRYFPNVDVPSQATVLSLKSGEERSGIDLSLPLAPTASVSGVVMGPLGPVPNVGVRVRHASETLVNDQAGDVATTTTRADGSFLMPAVPTGNYTIRVMRSPRPSIPAAQLAMLPAEMKTMLGAMAEPGPLDTMTLFAELPLPLERDVAGLTVTLTTGATVGGRIEFQGATPPASPQGVTVTLTSISGEWASGPMMMAQASGAAGVKEDGSFTTTGYPPGRYLISTAGRMPPGWFLKSAMINGVDAAWEPFELEGRDLPNVIITLTDKRSTITGTTQTMTGAPATASVVIFPAAWREWITSGMNAQLARVVRTPDAGTFSIAGMPPREYLMVAVDSAQAPDIQDPSVFEALARAGTSVSVAEGDTRTVTLRITQVQR